MDLELEPPVLVLDGGHPDGGIGRNEYTSQSAVGAMCRYAHGSESHLDGRIDIDILCRQHMLRTHENSSHTVYEVVLQMPQI